MFTAFNILVILLLVFLNGFFVAAEFAFVGVRRSRVEALASGGDRRARRLTTLLNDLNAYLSAAQLGITLASLALGWIGEPAVAGLLEGPLAGRVSETTLHVISLVIAFVLITSLHIVIGEQAPKLLGLARAERVALAAALPMQIFYRVFRWPVLALDWASARTVRVLGLNASAGHAAVYTEEELRHVIESSRQGGHIAEREQLLIGRIFDFSVAEVQAAMIPRTAVEAVPVTATFEETRNAFRTSGYSRLPVYREGLDDIVGLLFRKDLDMGQAGPDGFDLEKLARPPIFITPTATLGAALGQMQSSRVHFVFVVDEHGGTEGILTLEDLLEEIVGEIDDEFDEQAREQFISEGATYVMDAAMSIRDANQHLNLKLPEGESYATIAGFLLARAGRMLRRGDAVEHNGGVFSVESVDRFRIRRVRFTPQAQENQSPEQTLGAWLPLAGAVLVAALV